MIKANTYTVFLIVLFMLFGNISIAYGQQQKIGYVDTDYILSEMPEYEGVQQQLRW
jgi:outer membrane protein